MNMMTTLPTLVVRNMEGEGRVLDTDLGRALGMAQPEDIRRTIKAHMTELEQFGIVARAAINTGKRGRPGIAYSLNEEQATYVTMHCKTDRALAVKVQLLKVFTAWRHGSLVPVTHGPRPSPPPLTDRVTRCV